MRALTSAAGRRSTSLAVGGGSVTDTAKAIAIGVPYDGDFWDFFSGKMPEQALPVGTVLTIAASGSEGSPDSIITNEKTLEKNGAEADCLRALLLRAGPCPHGKPARLSDGLRHHGHHGPHL